MEYIDKHKAWTALKAEAESHELPASKEAYKRAARIIDQMPTVQIMEWISCEERMPDEGEMVLVCSYRKEVIKAFWDPDMDKFFVADSDSYYNQIDITHWQPLPEPPKGE